MRLGIGRVSPHGSPWQARSIVWARLRGPHTRKQGLLKETPRNIRFSECVPVNFFCARKGICFKDIKAMDRLQNAHIIKKVI